MIRQPFPLFIPGVRVTANVMNARNPRLVMMDNHFVINNTTTLTDTPLSFEMDGNAIYAYKLFISYTTSSSADLVYAWRTTPGVTPARFTHSNDRDVPSLNSGAQSIHRRPSTTTPIFAGGSGVNNFHSAKEEGTFITPPGGGSATLQVAQATADASDTTIYGQNNNTFVVYERIE